MQKQEAIARYFNNSLAQCAREIGCTYAAVMDWPEQLPPRIRDRVQAALWRRLQQHPIGAQAEELVRKP